MTIDNLSAERGAAGAPAAYTGAVMALLLRLAWVTLGCTGEEAPPAPRLEDLPPLPERRTQITIPGEERLVREAILALVGEVRGEIEPCGCPTLPYGGFVRRERQLEALRRQGVLFHLDAGEMLLKGFATGERGDAPERARLLLSLSAKVGVDAWAPGPSDLAALGLEALRQAPFPAVSATWTDPGGAPLFPASTVLEREGLRLGVIGLSAAPTDPSLQAQVSTRDPVAAAREALAALPADLDLVVGLGSLSDPDAERVAREVPGLAAILSTQGGSYEEAHVPSGGGALLVEAPDRGRYVEALYLRLGTGPGVPPRLEPPGEEWRSLLAARQRPGSAGLAKLEAAFAQAGTGQNLAYTVSYPLGESLEGAAGSASLVEGFKAQALRRAAEAAAAATTPVEPGYASSGRCTNCHRQEFARWVYTDHAEAWSALIARKSTNNPECVGCHSTGFGEIGGFGDMTAANQRKFRDVQCEECHGPMRGHPDDPRIKAQPITPQRCQVCHDAANSPDFDFATYLPRASCQPPSGE